jgi:hypothetical protein
MSIPVLSVELRITADMSLPTTAHRYAPDREVLPNGVIAETYGRAHTARQADAQDLLDEISWADSAVALTVRCPCRKGARLARVYRTAPPVIRIEMQTHRDADLRQVQAQLAPPPLARDTRIEYADTVVVDILTAPDDRDLEARCANCGRHELDRHAIIDALSARATELKIARP